MVGRVSTSCWFRGSRLVKSSTVEKIKITLNRNLKASWLCDALRLVASGTALNVAVAQMEQILKQDISGVDSITKSMRYIRHIWLDPDAATIPLRDDAVRLYKEHPSEEYARTLSYFMLIATYPFVREVAEVCGRLLRLQGSVKTEQIKRRIMEIYGEREPVLRSARYAVSILADLQLFKTGSSRGTYTAGSMTFLPEKQFASFCLSALFTSLSAEHGVRRRDLVGHPALFAFDAHLLVDCALTNGRFLISRESMTEDIVRIR
jgi:hypothetical protein